MSEANDEALQQTMRKLRELLQGILTVDAITTKDRKKCLEEISLLNAQLRSVSAQEMNNFEVCSLLAIWQSMVSACEYLWARAETELDAEVRRREAAEEARPEEYYERD